MLITKKLYDILAEKGILMYKYIAIYLIVMNLISFFQMGIDKQRAMKQEWRISEKTLWLFAILGGSAGAGLGMKLFRHKTKHASFKYGVPCLIIIQIICIFYIFNFLFGDA